MHQHDDHQAHQTTDHSPGFLFGHADAYSSPCSRNGHVVRSPSGIMCYPFQSPWQGYTHIGLVKQYHYYIRCSRWPLPIN